MATRHQARQAVVSFLYAYDLGNKDIVNFSEDVLEEKKIRNKQKDFALDLFNNTLLKLDFIDKIISKNLKDWSIERLGNVEKAILRLGVYEILFTKLEKAVIINEALEISKEIANEGSKSFINGILDSINKGDLNE